MYHKSLILAASALLVAAAMPATASHGFEASFHPVPGNEWWVEIEMDANEPLAGVDARANGGPWHELVKKEWGTWAKSFHVPEGSIVDFRARGTNQESIISNKYEWTDATFLQCPPAFKADFAIPAANAWWVEIRVQGNDAVDAVEAHVDGEATALERTDWGTWAKSFHVEDGSHVSFHASSGTQAAVSAVYEWPEANQVAPAPGFDAAFAPKASSEWWVETYAIAESPITHVEACQGDGQWQELEFRDWHAWAESFHVPDGSELTFRATNETGLTHTSDNFTWPSAEPVNGAGDWPREGSYAHYELNWGVGSMSLGDVDAIFVHHDGSWQVMCEGTGARDAPLFQHRHDDPPFGPTSVTIGQEVTVETFDSCAPGSLALTVEEIHEHDTRKDGDETTVTAWFGERTTVFDRRTADWETNTGLVIGFGDGGTDWGGGTLQDTDAPVD